MNYLLPILTLFLAITSVIDWKYKEIPSIFLTGILLVVLALNPSNIFLGLLSLVFALLIYEADFIGGIADIKIITIIGLTLTNFYWFFVYIILIFLFGIIWKFVYKKRFKKAKIVAFVPVLFFVFLALLMIGGVA